MKLIRCKRTNSIARAALPLRMAVPLPGLGGTNRYQDMFSITQKGYICSIIFTENAALCVWHSCGRDFLAAFSCRLCFCTGEPKTRAYSSRLRFAVTYRSYRETWSGASIGKIG